MTPLQAARPDVAVIGGGVIGCACAWMAARHGLRVALFEAGRIGAGATAAAMGHLVVLDDDPAELALARLSMARWAEWDGWAGLERLRCGTLWLAESEAQRLDAQARLARLNAADWPARWLDPAALHEAEPALARDLAGALFVPGDEIAFGPQLAQRLAGQVRALGGQVEEGARVQALCHDGLRLADGRHVAAAQVLLAAGCDSPRLWPGPAPLAVRPRKGVLAITDRRPGWIRHALVEQGYVGSAHGQSAESIAFNVQPRPGGQVLLGSTRQYGDASEAVDPSLLARVVARARRFLPQVGGLRLLRAWSGFRPATPDGRPLIGAVPGREAACRAWIATGHEGLGLTTAMGTAQLWLDLLLERRPAIDPRPFAPGRPMGGAGGGEGVA